MPPTRFRTRNRYGLLTIVSGSLFALLLLYRWLSQPPREILEFLEKNPDQPRPELVATGVSFVVPGWLVLIIVLVVAALIFAMWRSLGEKHEP